MGAFSSGLAVQIGGQPVTPLKNTLDVERSLADGSTFSCRVLGLRSELSHVTRLALVTVEDRATGAALFSGNVRQASTRVVSAGAADPLIEIDVEADGIEQQLYRRILTSAQAQQVNRTSTAAGQLYALARAAGDAYSAGDVGDDVPRLVGALGGDTVGALLRHLGDIQRVSPDGEISAFTRESLTSAATVVAGHVRRTSSYSGDLATTAQRIIAQGADTRFVRTATMSSDGVVMSAEIEAPDGRVIIDVTKVVALGTLYGAVTSGEELPVSWNVSRQSITLGLEIAPGSQLLVQVHGVWRWEIVRERAGAADALSGDQIINIPSSIEDDIRIVADRELARQQFPVETMALDMVLGSGLDRLDIGDAVQVEYDVQFDLDVFSPSAEDLWLVDRLRITQPAATQAAWSVWLARRQPDFRTREFWSRERSRTQADQNIVSATNYIPAPEISAAIPVQRITTTVNGVVDLNEYFRAAEGVVLTFTADVDNPATVEALVSDQGVLVLDGLMLGNTDITVTATNGARTAVQVLAVQVVVSLEPRIQRQIPDIQIERGGFQDFRLPSYFFDPDGDSLTYLVTQETDTSGSVTLSGASTVHVIPGSIGIITVTVRATDPSGLWVEQSFTVTVVEVGEGSTTVPTNQAPTASAIPAQALEVGEVITIDLGNFFNDPDSRDRLTYSGSSSDTSKVTASVAGSQLTLRGIAQGASVIRATASDGELSTFVQFTATVAAVGTLNRAPVITRTIPAVTGQANLSQRVSNLDEYFSDPNGDSLTFTASSSRTGVVRVAISGGVHLDLTGRGAGNATVTVTATDPSGLSIAQQVSVSLAQAVIPNRAPVISQSIADQAVTAATERRLTLSRFFSDPDDDNLTYAATSSATGRATVAVASGILTLRGVSPGDATVTVTASDGSLSVRQQFSVTVTAVAARNRAPRVAQTAPDRTLRVGRSFSLDLSQYFTDPDDDDLSFSAVSDDTDAVTAGVSGDLLTVRAIAVGSADVTITASDGNLTVQQVVTVTVRANQAPVVSRAIGSQSIGLNQARNIDLAEHFSDPDGDDLTYRASSSATGRATVAVANGVLTVTAVSAGSATVTVTASDGDLSRQATFSVVVQSNVVVTTDTDTIYRRATSLPGAPSGGTGNRTHTPSGWTRGAQPDPTGTLNVYRSRRTRTYRDGSFSSASSWGSPVLVASAVPVVTTDTDSIYRRGTTAPGTPTGGTSNRTHTPSGWSRTQLSATSTQNVYRSQRVRTYSNGSFTSATSWEAPTLFEAAVPVVTTDTDSIYRRSSTVPGTPSGGTNDGDHLPTGWSRTEPDPISGSPVYRSQRVRTYTNGAFTSATAWGAPVLVASLTITSRTETIYRRATSTPAAPSGTNTENAIPAGWQRSEPTPTTTENVYRSRRNSFFTNGVYTNSSTWSDPVKVADKTATITTDTDSIYRRGTSTPGTPSGGTTSRTHTPNGWSRTNPGASTTQNVYRSRRTRTYSNGSFTSASAWGSPVKIADAVPNVTTDTDRIYRRASSSPSRPSGGTINENHLPTGWSRTKPGATIGNAVYRSERVRTYTNGAFTSATAWSAVAVEEPALQQTNRRPVVTNKFRASYSVRVGAGSGIPVHNFFDDPDDDELTFMAVSSAPSRVRVRLSATHVLFDGRAAGTATITVTASDGKLSVSQSFTVTATAAVTRTQYAAELGRLTSGFGSQFLDSLLGRHVGGAVNRTIDRVGEGPYSSLADLYDAVLQNLIDGIGLSNIGGPHRNAWHSCATELGTSVPFSATGIASRGDEDDCLEIERAWDALT